MMDDLFQSPRTASSLGQHCRTEPFGEHLALATWHTAAVPIKKSVFPEYTICLEDGKRLKMLKRHLKTSYDMTPAEYRAK